MTISAERRLLVRCRDLLGLLVQLRQQQAALLEEQQVLLEQLRAWLKLQRELGK